MNSNQIFSIKIGKIQHSIIQTNSPISRSSNINCTDCLCNCFNQSSSCLGINCFPLNHTCQLIQPKSWILESDIQINTTSNNFLAIKENISRLCSCYTPSKLLDFYGKTNLTDSSTTTTNIVSVKYISNDDSIIVINSTLIRKLSANNFNYIIRSLTVPSTSVAISILHNDTKIYIAFLYNRSVNMYDLNLTLLQTSMSWSNQVAVFGGMFLYNNRILIIDILHSIIWTIDSLNQTSLNTFWDFSSYNIINATSLFIYQNHSLFISSLSKNLYIFNLNNFTLQQTLTLSLNISMLFMRYDSNCDRLWFGTDNYTYAPVFDLALNQMNIYLTKGIISQYGLYSIDFDENYTAFYSNTNGNLREIYLSDISC